MKILYIPAVTLLISGCATYERLERPSYSLDEPATIKSGQGQESLLTINEPGTWTVESVANTSSFSIVGPGNAKLPDTDQSHPVYQLKKGDRSGIYVSNRLLNVEGVLNFRDLGGLTTSDGRQVKWGYIYRSGKMNKLTKTGLNEIKKLQIQTVLDLRTPEEVAKKPDKIPSPGPIEWINLPYGGMHYHEIHQARKDIRKQTPEAFNGDGKMEQLSRRFVHEATPQLKKIFDLLLDENSVPLVFHCTAGKDRTGFTSAMILSSLGVDRETIMNEYLLSNHYRYDLIERKAKLGARLLGIDHTASRTIMDVRPSYLQAGFDEIEKVYGSVDNFLREGVGLTVTETKSLREKYLYPQ